MTVQRGVRGLAGLLVAAGLVGCGEDEAACPPLVVSASEACETTADCVEAGFSTLTCVNRRCRLPCVADSDCELSTSDACRDEQGPPPDAVCVDQLCRERCGPGTCAEGEVCHDGRCVLGFEGFEDRDGVPVPSLERFGWNALESRELDNPTHALAETGFPGCNLGDLDCAGVAKEGVRFVLIGTRGTSEKGTATLEPTCRPCACCLDCRADPGPYAAGSAGCPLGDAIPAPLMCTETSVCAEVCQACDRCDVADRTLGPNLLTCEARAAERSCPACPRCQADACRSCRMTTCADDCVNLDNPACVSCEEASCPACADCRDCEACGEAQRCERVDPNAAECRSKRERCDALGDDGCFPTPIGYPRSELTEAEQALVSPAIDLSVGSGDVVLSFAYVPFGVGRSYFESRQGVPASMWARRAQEVRVQLCSASCEQPTSWVDAERLDGTPASFPGPGGRDNGLSVGKQSEVDWRRGRVEVRVPADLRSSQLRFRFLPRLGSEARVGIDDIHWREAR